MKCLTLFTFFLLSVTSYAQSHQVGDRDTTKCILLVYQDGPVPLQIKGYAVREWKFNKRPPDVILINDHAYFQDLFYLDNRKQRIVNGFIWMNVNKDW